MSATLPPRLRVELGPPRFSGPTVGPADPYLRDCWTAVLGPSQVLCLSRLHQMVGTEIPMRALAQSLGTGNSTESGRLRSGLGRLADYGALSLQENICQLSPGLRYLTPVELHRAGVIVEGLHAAHLRSRQLDPRRIARLAWDGAASLQRPARVRGAPILSMVESP